VTIPIFKPRYNKARILAEIAKVLDSGWTGLGPKCEEFELALAGYLGSSYAVSVNSCTSALHLALVCLDLPPHSKVVVPDITFVSTAAAVLHAGHVPVLAPVDRSSLCLDLTWLEDRLKTDTIGAVMPVHFAGHCCNMDVLMSLCNENSATVIEDCAHAMGSRYKGQSLGTFGDLGCFSFHSVKNLPISDAGAVIGKPQYQEPLRRLRWLGISKSTYDRSGGYYTPFYEIEQLGYKYHSNDLLAVVGLANLEILEEGNQRRREIFKRYVDELPELCFASSPNVCSSCHLVSCFIHGRDEFIRYMNAEGVSIGSHYQPLSSFKAFHWYAVDDVRQRSQEIFALLATLPCYPDLSALEQDYIISKIKSYLQGL
jgi:dTDP-4-amino-4,6-dideoxygalactose transaminase